MFSEPNFLQRQTRWIVLGLLFCMGMAMASPLVKPKSLALVCTGANAVALVDIDATGEPGKLLAMALDCADCLPAVLPPPHLAVGTFEKPVQARMAMAKSLSVPDAQCLSPPSRGPPIPVSPT